LADQLAPAAAAVANDLSDLRAIADAAEQARKAEGMIAEKVAAARALGAPRSSG
jgi:hypothetical protein